MTLATLLDELKEVDAEEWEEILDWLGGLKNGLHGHVPSYDSDLGQAIIQNSIQRACEEWRWYWHTAFGSVTGRYIGTVNQSTEVAGSAAEALLAAYIAAVRASQ